MFGEGGVQRRDDRGPGSGSGARSSAQQLHVRSFDASALVSGPITAIAVPPVTQYTRQNSAGEPSSPVGVLPPLEHAAAQAPPRLICASADGSLLLITLERDLFADRHGETMARGDAFAAPGMVAGVERSTAAASRRLGSVEAVVDAHGAAMGTSVDDETGAGAVTVHYIRPLQVSVRTGVVNQGDFDPRSAAETEGQQPLMAAVQLFSANRGTLSWPADLYGNSAGAAAPAVRPLSAAAAAADSLAAAVTPTSTFSAAAAALRAQIPRLITALVWVGRPSEGPQAGSSAGAPAGATEELLITGSASGDMCVWTLTDPIAMRLAASAKAAAAGGGLPHVGGSSALPDLPAHPAAHRPYDTVSSSSSASYASLEEGHVGRRATGILLSRDAARLTFKTKHGTGGAGVTGLSWDASGGHGIAADANGVLWYTRFSALPQLTAPALPPASSALDGRGRSPTPPASAALAVADPSAEAPQVYLGLRSSVLRAALKSPVRLLAAHASPVSALVLASLGSGALAVSAAGMNSSSASSSFAAAAAATGAGRASSAAAAAAAAAAGADASALASDPFVTPPMPLILFSAGDGDGSVRAWNATPRVPALHPLSLPSPYPLPSLSAQRLLAAVPGLRGELSPPSRGTSRADSRGNGRSGLPPLADPSQRWSAVCDQLLLLQSASAHSPTAFAITAPLPAVQHRSAPPSSAGSAGASTAGGRTAAAQAGSAYSVRPAPARIAVGFGNGAIRVFSLEAMKEECRSRAHTQAVTQAAAAAAAAAAAQQAAQAVTYTSLLESPSRRRRAGAGAADVSELPRPRITAMAWTSLVAGGSSTLREARRTPAGASQYDIAVLVSGDVLGRVFITPVHRKATATSAGTAAGVGSSAAGGGYIPSFSLRELAEQSASAVDVEWAHGGAPVTCVAASASDPSTFLVACASGAVTVWRLLAPVSHLETASAPRVLLMAAICASSPLSRRIAEAKADARCAAAAFASLAAGGASAAVGAASAGACSTWATAGRATTLSHSADGRTTADAVEELASGAAEDEVDELAGLRQQLRGLQPGLSTRAGAAPTKPQAAAATRHDVWVDVTCIAARVAWFAQAAIAILEQPPAAGELMSPPMKSSGADVEPQPPSVSAAPPRSHSPATALGVGHSFGLAAFCPGDSKLVTVLVPVSRMQRPVPLGALQRSSRVGPAVTAHGQGAVPHAVVFVDVAAGRVVRCTPPLPGYATCVSVLAPSPELLQEVAAASAAEADDDGSVSSGDDSSTSGPWRAGVGALPSRGSFAGGASIAGSVVRGLADFVLGGDSAAGDDNEVRGAQDESSVAQEARTALRREIAVYGALIVGTCTQPSRAAKPDPLALTGTDNGVAATDHSQVLLVGCGPRTLGQILACGPLQPGAMTSVSAQPVAVAMQRGLPDVPTATEDPLTSTTLRRSRKTALLAEACGGAAHLAEGAAGTKKPGMVAANSVNVTAIAASTGSEITLWAL